MELIINNNNELLIRWSLSIQEKIKKVKSNKTNTITNYSSYHFLLPKTLYNYFKLENNIIYFYSDDFNNMNIYLTNKKPNNKKYKEVKISESFKSKRKNLDKSNENKQFIVNIPKTIFKNISKNNQVIIEMNTVIHDFVNKKYNLISIKVA